MFVSEQNIWQLFSVAFGSLALPVKLRPGQLKPWWEGVGGSFDRRSRLQRLHMLRPLIAGADPGMIGTEAPPRGGGLARAVTELMSPCPCRRQLGYWRHFTGMIAQRGSTFSLQCFRVQETFCIAIDCNSMSRIYSVHETRANISRRLCSICGQSF